MTEPTGSRRRANWSEQPVTAVAVFAGLALLAVLTSAPGRYVGENRLDQYFAPGRRLLRTMFMWDPTRGMGRVREDLWPLNLGPLAFLRGLGLSPVMSQRIWHAALISIAAAGAAAVAREVRGVRLTRRPHSALAPLVAGLLYGFGPYSITFLTPSNLYSAYAVAPWVVLMAMRGPGGRDRWRSAAVAALLIGSLGNADYPGVVLSLLTVPLAAMWSTQRAGVGLRRAFSWLAVTGALAIGVSAAALWKTAASAGVFAQRVTSTETPEVVGVASSWSETWRGLGFWLSYFRADVLARPQTSDLFTSPVMVLVTFVPAVVALVALVLPEVRGRVVLGLSIVLSAVVMVGIHPVTDPVPVGVLGLDLLDLAPVTAGFRTTYKAGAGLMLGLAVLGGLGAHAIAGRARRDGENLLSLAAVILAVLVGLPAWTGGLYDASRTSGDIPDYWYDAARVVNAIPGDGRVLVLPASTRSVYEWGWVGDDILDALITRAHATDTAVPLSGPDAADVLAAVSASTSNERHRPGAVAAVLRRLGIDYVLVRNDLDAEATRTLSLEQIALFRQDEGLSRVAVFGEQLGGDDLRRSTATSGSLIGQVHSAFPVELFQVNDPGPLGPRLAPEGGELLVSGSGDAMVSLGAGGDLAGAGSVRFSGALTPDEMADALEADGRLVLSDSNRRRVTVVSALVRDQSWTLAEGEDLDRPGEALYDTPGSQSTAWYRDATRITSSGAPRGGRGAQPWTRPAAAFDGFQSTWWQTVEAADQLGLRLRVDLREPETITRVRIDPVPAPARAQRLTEVIVHLGDRQVPIDVSAGAVEVDVEPTETDSIEIEVAEVSPGARRPVGVREVSLRDGDGEPLDLREQIALPDDVLRAAADDARLEASLAEAPMTVLVERDRPDAELPVEAAIRRRFRLPHDIVADVRAQSVVTDAAQVELLRLAVGRCEDSEVLVDGDRLPMMLDEAATLAVGATVEWRSCEPVELAAGWRHLEVGEQSTIGSVRLDSVGDAGSGSIAAEPAAVDGEVVEASVGADRMELVVDAPEGAVLITGQSFDPRWFAIADGQDLGPAGIYDGQSGWVLPPGEAIEVDVYFRPASRLRVAMWVSLLTVMLCVGLIFRGRRSRRRDDEADSDVAGDGLVPVALDQDREASTS